MSCHVVNERDLWVREWNAEDVIAVASDLKPVKTYREEDKEI